MANTTELFVRGSDAVLRQITLTGCLPELIVAAEIAQ